jgi:hypothetical protein
MKLTNIGLVIAVRELSLSGGTTVSVIIGRPEPFPDGNGCYCPYQFLGIGDQRVRYAGGEDTVQALMLTLEKIGTDLYTSPEAKAGLLTLNGSRDLDFPVPHSIRDLAPT